MSPAQLTVDETGQSQLNWIDDKGDKDAPAPPNAQVTYSVDNPAVGTADPNTGVVTPAGEGDANLTATITDSTTGGPLMEPDGVTPFSVQPAPFRVVAGQAVAAGELSIQPMPPAPAP